jgi:hypothetical protein
VSAGNEAKRSSVCAPAGVDAPNAVAVRRTRVASLDARTGILRWMSRPIRQNSIKAGSVPAEVLCTAPDVLMTIASNRYCPAADIASVVTTMDGCPSRRRSGSPIAAIHVGNDQRILRARRNITSRSARGNGNGRSTTASRMLNMAVVAPTRARASGSRRR